MDVDDVIQCAAALVDNGQEPNIEYERGVVELAARLCMSSTSPDNITVMGYAVYGVNRPATWQPEDLHPGTTPQEQQ